jgi:predicted nucleic acid-binding protein
VGLTDALPPGPVAIDTVGFIYFIEDHPRFAPAIAPLFEAADRGDRRLVTSALTLIEVLAVPYRVGDLSLAERYEALLSRSRGLDLVDLDRAQLRSAAALRAAYNIRTPDALQLAAAHAASCQSFVTNDRHMPAPPGITVIQLSDHIE